MATKNNIRSFRYSDEVACILGQQPGKSLNEKFENLVHACYFAVEEKEAQLAKVNSQIEQRRQVLRNLEKATSDLTLLQNDLENAKRYLRYVERKAKMLSETEM